MTDQAIGSEIGRKLSVAEFGWNKPNLQRLTLSDQNAKHFLVRFTGAATAVKPYKDKETGETKFGLMGQFEGVDADGVVLSGSVLYLPGYVNDMVVAALSASDDIAAVRIAFDVYAKYDEKSATSYTYVANDLLNTQLTSVAEVKEQIKSLPMPGGMGLKALEAPKK